MNICDEELSEGVKNLFMRNQQQPNFKTLLLYYKLYCVFKISFEKKSDEYDLDFMILMK